MLGVNAYQPVRCFEVHGNDIARLSKLWQASLRYRENLLPALRRPTHKRVVRNSEHRADYDIFRDAVAGRHTTSPLDGVSVQNLRLSCRHQARFRM
jgi:hypothetical protein